MSKIGLVIEREYLTRVKKKSFLLMTILVPVIIMAFYALMIGIAMNDSDEKQKIAVIDNDGLFGDTTTVIQNKKLDAQVVKKDETSFLKSYKDDGFNAVVVIPKGASDSLKGFTVHSKSTIGLKTTSEIEDMISSQVEMKRLRSKGISFDEYKNLSPEISLRSNIDNKEGSAGANSGIAYGISFFCGFLIYFMMLIYGGQVMRGVSEEKINRISEVIVSSVKPFDLMMGKILGIGAVGLTQFLIWIVLGLGLQALVGAFLPGMGNAAAAAAGSEGTAGMMHEITTGLSSLPILKIGLSFLFYFLGGYLLYASLFSAVGSVVSDDQQEAQQLTMPIMMPIILGFVILTRAIDQPNSSLAVFGSLFPLTSPVVMMGRVTYDIPVWQIALSMILLIVTIIFFAWLAAKIYRTGILMYGKKASWKEMIKWAFTKS